MKKLLPVIFLFFVRFTYAQPQTIDGVAAVVGKNVVLISDVESQYNDFIRQGSPDLPDLRCRILDQLLLNKLLLHQADLDSLVVTDEQVLQKIDQNLNYYIQQMGGTDKIEKFYGKSIPEIKEDFKPIVKDQLMAAQMKNNVTKGVTASPADIKEFYKEIPPDSLPLINTEFEYAQILYKVPLSEEKKKAARETLTKLRERILNGEDFGALAVLYSQDKGSARMSGELGFLNRGDLVPEFEAVAFRLKNTSVVSEIVETQFGFHIIQLVERRGDQINVRHILIKAENTSEDIQKAKVLMDSVAKSIHTGVLKFAEAAEKYSTDKDSKMNGGLVMNPASGSPKFSADQLDPSLLFQFDKMSPGDVSDAVYTTTRETDDAFRIVYLKKRTEPHRLNLQDDYQQLQELTLNDKQQKAVEAWRNKKKSLTYVRIADDYKSCAVLKDWLNP